VLAEGEERVRLRSDLAPIPLGLLAGLSTADTLVGGQWHFSFKGVRAHSQLIKKGYIAIQYSISFTTDNKTLLTDRGALSINNKFIAHTTTVIRNAWVQRDNYNLLVARYRLT
jgi:hypothetical protein